MSLALLVPAYNAAHLLPNLFETVANQSGQFDEIWVYDDASTDDTARVAERLGANVVRGDINRGCTFAKSVLVGRTHCDWVHFHDADDLLKPNFIFAAGRWLSRPDVDVIVFGCEERWADTAEVISIGIPDDDFLAADPVGYAISRKINAISGVYRRAAFLAAGGFDLDPDVLYNEDQAYHCALARAGLRFRGDPSVTVTNLRQRTSMWVANQDRCLRAHYHVMRKMLESPLGPRYERAIAERLWHVVAGSSSLLDWDTADAAAALAMRLGGVEAAPSGQVFKMLCRVSPHLALRVREWLIRGLKPKYRQGYPGWRMRFGF